MIAYLHDTNTFILNLQDFKKFKVYKAISYKGLEKKPKSIKMCYLNIHLTITPFTLTIYFICQLLSIIVRK